jgi:hypothetical protein
MVDGSVKLHEEESISTSIRGVADVQATAVGILKVGGLQFSRTLKVPGLGVNLISEGVLHQHGCDIVSCASGGWRRVYLAGKVIIEAHYEQGLFIWRPTVNF